MVRQLAELGGGDVGLERAGGCGAGEECLPQLPAGGDIEIGVMEAEVDAGNGSTTVAKPERQDCELYHSLTCELKPCIDSTTLNTACSASDTYLTRGNMEALLEGVLFGKNPTLLVEGTLDSEALTIKPSNLAELYSGARSIQMDQHHSREKYSDRMQTMHRPKTRHNTSP